MFLYFFPVDNFKQPLLAGAVFYFREPVNFSETTGFQLFSCSFKVLTFFEINAISSKK